MFFVLFIVLILVVLMVHELSHRRAMIKNGIKVPEAGLGIPIKGIPSLKIRISSNLTFKIHPLLLGAYVMPENEEAIEKLPYDKQAEIFGAGIIGNIIMGLILTLPILILITIKGNINTEIIIRLIIPFILIPLFWKFSRQISAYVFPFLGIPLIAFLVWSIFAFGADETIIGPVGIVQLGLNMSTDIFQTISLAAALSLGLAITNLLPLIPLDGGRITHGWISKTKINRKFKSGFMATGYITLLLVITVMYYDISRVLS